MSHLLIYHVFELTYHSTTDAPIKYRFALQYRNDEKRIEQHEQQLRVQHKLKICV